MLDNTRLSVNFDGISSVWRTDTTCFWKKCIRQKTGSMLWQMRLGEGCSGEKRLMRGLRLRGRPARACGKEGFVMSIMQLACTVYCFMVCNNASYARHRLPSIIASALGHKGSEGGVRASRPDFCVFLLAVR